MQKPVRPSRRMSIRAAIAQDMPEIPQSDNTVIEQNDNMLLSQNSNTVLPQSDNTAKRQYGTKTQERDKVTYYLDPGQLDKLDELRTAYRKRTGKRLSEQDFMRMIVTKLELDMLV
jgi:hypothetical protein